MRPGLTVREDDLEGVQVRDLLALHMAGMHAHTPAGQVHALDLSGLQRPNITVFTAWDAEQIAGIGALKQQGEGQAEVKSMRTHPDFLRQGVAAALLERIIAEARTGGARRLSLETGTGEAFEPALMLYRRRGFVDCGPFGDYAPTGFSQFLHLDL